LANLMPFLLVPSVLLCVPDQSCSTFAKASADKSSSCSCSKSYQTVFSLGWWDDREKTDARRSRSNEGDAPNPVPLIPSYTLRARARRRERGNEDEHLVAELGRTTSCPLRLCGEAVPLRALIRLHARFPCAVSNPARPANPPGQAPP